MLKNLVMEISYFFLDYFSYNFREYCVFFVLRIRLFVVEIEGYLF